MSSPVLEQLSDGMRNEGISIYSYPNNRTMYELLRQRGLMACESRLSDLGGQFVINGVTVRVVSKEYATLQARARKRSFVQRVYVDCTCGKQVPFGRLHQHKCK